MKTFLQQLFKKKVSVFEKILICLENYDKSNDVGKRFLEQKKIHYILRLFIIETIKSNNKTKIFTNFLKELEKEYKNENISVFQKTFPKDLIHIIENSYLEKISILYYQIWKDSHFNPSNKTEKERYLHFPYEKFNISSFSLPIESSSNYNSVLPIWHNSGNSGNLFSNPFPNNYLKIIDKGLSHKQIIDVEFIDGNDEDYYEHEDYNDKGFFIDNAIRVPFHIYSPILVFDYDFEETKIHSIFSKNSNKLVVDFQPIPTFLLQQLNKRDPEFLDKIQLKDEKILLLKPLSQYKTLNYLKKHSIINYLINTKKIPYPKNMPSVDMGFFSIDIFTLYKMVNVFNNSMYERRIWYKDLKEILIILDFGSLECPQTFFIQKAIDNFNRSTKGSRYHTIKVKGTFKKD